MTYPSVPWLLSALSCLLAAALTLLLPETSGTTLPDVVDEAEVAGLAHGGDVFRSCYTRYGRSPYWTQLDTEGAEATLQVRGEVCVQHERFDEKFEQSLDSDADVDNSGVPRKCHAPPRSPDSHSSDSLASLMSLVDVSHVNGNNSDTSDSSDHDSPGAVPGRRLCVTDKEAKIKKITAEYSDFQEGLPEGREGAATNSTLSRKRDDATDFELLSTGDPLSGQSDNREASLEVLCDEAVENDFSLSVFSLKFRHIKRPVSPTDRRTRPDLHYSSSSSSGDTPQPGKTLVQDYISHHCSSGDGTDSRSNSRSEKDETEGTLYRAEPFVATLGDDPEVFQHTEQLKKIQESSNNDAGDRQVYRQPMHERNKHEANASHSKIEARDQSRGSLSVSPSPEPRPKRRRPSPATQVPACGSLSDKPHSAEMVTCNSSPPSRYYLTTLLEASSGNRTDHSTTNIVHPKQGDRRSEGGEPDFKATAGKCKAGSSKSDEKPAVLRGVERTLSAGTLGKSRTGELDATVSE